MDLLEVYHAEVVSQGIEDPVVSVVFCCVFSVICVVRIVRTFGETVGKNETRSGLFLGRASEFCSSVSYSSVWSMGSKSLELGDISEATLQLMNSLYS